MARHLDGVRIYVDGPKVLLDVQDVFVKLYGVTKHAAKQRLQQLTKKLQGLQNKPLNDQGLQNKPLNDQGLQNKTPLNLAAYTPDRLTHLSGREESRSDSGSDNLSEPLPRSDSGSDNLSEPRDGGQSDACREENGGREKNEENGVGEESEVNDGREESEGERRELRDGVTA